MQRLVVVIVIAALAWFAYGKYRTQLHDLGAGFWQQQGGEIVVKPRARADRSETGAFRCDGRTRCSQMTSCAEATFFLQNCPGVKMDGDKDGIPCERQWCQ